MSEYARLIIAVDSDQAKKAGVVMNNLARTTSGAEKQARALTSAAKSLAGPLAAALSVREVYQATEAYTSMTNRLRLVTSGAEQMAEAQDAVFRIAQAGRQPLSETAELYQRIATNQDELGLTGAGVARVTETISKSLAVSGASAASAAGALTQLGQAFASGQLRGEELNSVLENAPALAQALARGMGVTVGQLRELGKEGKISAQTVVDALLSQSEEMDKTFGKLAPNISGAMTTVGNSLTQLIGKMDETGGTSSQLAESIMSVAEILADPATVDAAQAFGSGIATSIGWIATAATNTVGTVKWMAEELASALHGVAADDIVRLEDQLATYQEMLDNPLRRLRIGGDGQALKIFDEDEIQQNIAILQEQIKQYYELGLGQDNAGESAQENAPKLEQFRTGVAGLGRAMGSAAGDADKLTKAYQGTLADLDRKIYMYGLTGEAAALAYELERGELQKLGPARKSHLEGLARELDVMEALKEAAEEMTARDRDRLAMVDRLAERQREIDIDVQGVGFGDREIEEMRTVSEVRQRFADERLQLARDQNDKDRALSREAFQARMDDLREFEAREIELVEEGAQRKAEAQAQWQNGARRAWETYRDGAADVATQTEQMFTAGFTSMEDALVQFATTGKLSFSDFANSVIEDMARIAARQAATGLLQMGVSAVMGMAGGGSTLVSSGGSSSGMLTTLQAKGGAWDEGVQKFAKGGAFTNSIVSSPTLFPTGLMGEAGPEAIMPLHRGSDGSLGVRAAGAAQQASSTVVIQQTISVPASQAEAPGVDSNALATAYAESAKNGAKTQIAQELRPGGSIWRALNQRR